MSAASHLWGLFRGTAGDGTQRSLFGWFLGQESCFFFLKSLKVLTEQEPCWLGLGLVLVLLLSVGLLVLWTEVGCLVAPGDRLMAAFMDKVSLGDS